jgi:outer membrane protein TolC
MDWWRGFRSKELTVLMEEAQTVNLDIAAAVARIRQADALAQTAGAALLPNVTGTFSGSRSRSSSNTGVVTSGSAIGRGEVTNHVASMSASYEIDFWGKNRDALLAAEETANANRFDRDVVALTTLASVANAYFNVVASQERINIATRNIASAQRIYDAIKARVDAGTGRNSILRSRRACWRTRRPRSRRCGKRWHRTPTFWPRWWRVRRSG